MHYILLLRPVPIPQTFSAELDTYDKIPASAQDFSQKTLFRTHFVAAWKDFYKGFSVPGPLAASLLFFYNSFPDQPIGLDHGFIDTPVSILPCPGKDIFYFIYDLLRVELTDANSYENLSLPACKSDCFPD